MHLGCQTCPFCVPGGEVASAVVRFHQILRKPNRLTMQKTKISMGKFMSGKKGNSKREGEQTTSWFSRSTKTRSLCALAPLKVRASISKFFSSSPYSNPALLSHTQPSLASLDPNSSCVLYSLETSSQSVGTGKSLSCWTYLARLRRSWVLRATQAYQKGRPGFGSGFLLEVPTTNYLSQEEPGQLQHCC
jgi:hypothetical protein